jgi:hypothetical protein
VIELKASGVPGAGGAKQRWVFACPAAAYTAGAEKYLMRDSHILAGTTATYMPGVGHKRVLERGMNRDEGRTCSQRPGFEGTGAVCSSQVQTEKYELQEVKKTYAESKNLNQDVALGMTLENCASLHNRIQNKNRDLSLQYRIWHLANAGSVPRSRLRANRR